MSTIAQPCTTLSSLQKNQRGIIRHCNADGLLKQKLISMGFVPGVEILMVRNAPLRDPIEISLQNYLVTLRRNEARLIEVLAL
ncbi:ferrous iron transport protein A [Desulfosarcina sp. OttesenSCG-928-A07]|nr:ferrous iron transport protein A [Desulfosarcina sp. OttesenSCG-928-G17]MDL2328642.1 ferrous iron transport protein A [Desulfosarcina sp. OttesenSCG-928-A07]